MDNKSISEFIKEIRKKNNLTQKELAEKLGVTYQAVSKWERAINMPDKSLLIKMSKEYNVSLDDIFKTNKSKKKYIYLISSIIIIIIFGLFTYLNINNSKDFQFKTLSSSCKDYKVEGVLSYNKKKSAIYISNITYCGKDISSKFTKLECSLYENNNNIKNKLGSYTYNKNIITLEEFLKKVKFTNKEYNSICTKYTENSLELEIIGTTTTKEIYSHIIPVSINNNC